MFVRAYCFQIPGALLLGLCALVGTSTVSHAAIVTIDFEGVDTSGGAVSGAALDAYLAGFGVTLTNVVAPANTVVIDRDGVNSVFAASGDNFLDQFTGVATSRSYDLEFNQALDSFTFTRTAYFGASSSGLIYPAWSATAFDAGGSVLGVVGEGVAFIFAPPSDPVPAKTFSLNTPGIAKIRFFGDHLGFAGRAAAAVDDFVLETSAVSSSVPEPSTFIVWSLLTALGIGVAGRRRRRS